MMASKLRVWLVVAVLGVLCAPWAARAQSKASDYALAEQYYQRGLRSEQMGDAQFRTWVRTIDSKKLDVWRDRRVFSIEMYRNAIRLNPSHWQAHERLAFAFHEAAGTHANNELSMLHFVSFLALNPGYPKYPVAKQIVDKKVREYTESQMFIARRAAGDIYSELTYRPASAMGGGMMAGGMAGSGSGMPMGSGSEGPAGGMGGGAQSAGPMADVQGVLAALNQFTHREVGGGLSSLALLKPGVYTETQPMGLPEHRVVEGFYNQLPDTAASILSDSHRRALETAVLQSVGYVECYLGIIGQLTDWMKYLDRNGVAYDPRLPNMLIGECALQLRMCLLQGPVMAGDQPNSAEGLARYRNDIAALTALGGVTAAELWSSRDLTKPLPDRWLDESGEMEEGAKNAAEYKRLSELSALAMPAEYIDETPPPATAGGGMMGGPMGAPMGSGGPMMGGMPGAGGAQQQVVRTYPSEARIAAFDLAANEAYKAYLIWRTAHLIRATRSLGFSRIDDFMADTANRVASGDLPIWQYGALSSTSSRLPTG